MLHLLLVPALLLVAAEEHKLEAPAAAVAPQPPAALEQIQNVNLPTLAAATSVTVSPDGRFLYAAAFARGEINIFKRDPETGMIELKDTVTGPSLNAAVKFRLSQDGRLGVASAFRANAITLFKRDAVTGHLTQLDSAAEGEGGNAGLGFVIDAVFSRDGRHVYTASSAGVGAFKIEEERLHFLQLQSADDQLRGLRGVTVSPDGRTIYAAATSSSTLAVLRPNQETGMLQVLQLIKDGEGEANEIEGVFRIACSPNGEHVYVSAGRFGGDNAVSVFEAQSDGKLKLIARST